MFVPINSLGANGRPLGLEISQHVAKHWLIGLRSLILELFADFAGLVVHRLLGRERLLELTVFVQSAKSAQVFKNCILQLATVGGPFYLYLI